MPPSAPQIRPLPEAATARLRSTLAITALPDAVSELLQNALDAGARNVTVQANVARNSCVVEDDGEGIVPADVGVVGRMYATSKYPPPAAGRPATFGFRGQALSALSTHSLFTLTSRHAAHRSTHTTRISYSTPLSAGPAPAHLCLPAAGTVVRIDGLHADLPVRFAARLRDCDSPDREWADIARRIAQLLLTPAGRGVAVTARDEHGARRVAVAAAAAKDGPWELAVIRQVYGRDAAAAGWERVRAVQGPVAIRGWVGARGRATREIQFLYVNGHPLPAGATVLHAEANRVFAGSAFGAAGREGEGEGEGEGGREGRRKGVERYAMFVLWVECEGAGGGGGADVLGGEGGTGGKAGLEGAYLAAAVGLLQRLLREFLRTHHFRPVAGGDRAARTPAGDELQRGAATSRSRPGTPPGAISNGSTAENHGDPRALALRSRVKSARADPREEEGRNGAGFSAKESVFSSPSPAAAAAAVCGSAAAAPESCKENDAHVLRRNPVSKRPFEANARTGNTAATGPARKRPAPVSSPRTGVDARDSSSGGSISKKPRTDGDIDKKGPFVEALLKGWKNPVFAHAQAPIPSLAPGAPCSHDFAAAAPAALAKLTKPGLQSARVIAQVDRKYILIKMRGLSTAAGAAASETAPELLVLVDQHAADERVRAEALFAGLASSPKPLPRPLVYAVAPRDAQLLRRYEPALRRWSVRYRILLPAGDDGGGGGAPALHVTALPAAVAERCAAEPALAVEMLRRHVYALAEGRVSPPGAAGAGEDKDWVLRMSSCPEVLVEMVNSRACRGAVMFNDVLERGECVRLVERLAACRFPFMCAHGRPSMVPVVDLGVCGGGGGGGGGGAESEVGGGAFKADFGRWMRERRCGEGR